MDGDLLQAVVLADSFDTKFYPITLEMPRSLLPLVNVPTIDYTLEFLVGAGVQEIFILCCWKAQQIQAYISQSRWTETPNVVIRTIASTRCLSTGDALREIYNLQIISSDFVLVSGDVISNMKLQPVLQAHRARRKQDKSTIMTVVYKKAAPNHRSRSQEDDSVVVINPATGQLLNLENDREEDAVNLDTDVFAENSSVQFRYDLLDCRIDICSPEVLSVCADNFDYNDLRQDFIRGVVVDEVYKYKIFTHIISTEYAARVNILRTYDSVSKDIIHRWAYPMVPDCNFMGTTSYKYLRGNIYQEEGIKLARSATLGRDTVIGQGTEVGNNTFISHSVIGRNCKIGANVKIVGSYIWNGATVADGATISYSIVCNEARIMAGAVVDKASLVSFRAVVGTGARVGPCAKIALEPEEENDEVEFEEAALGPNGAGVRWIETDPLNQLLVEEEERDDSDTNSEFDDATDSEGSDMEEPGLDTFDGEEERWVSEVEATVERAVEENHAIDNLRLELKTLKFTFEHRTFSEMACIALRTLINIAVSSNPKPVPAMAQLVGKWAPLMNGYVVSVDEQVALLNTLLKYCEEYPAAEPGFMHVINGLYNLDIIEEESVWAWQRSLPQTDGPHKKILQACEPFFKWLKEAEEEDEDDDEDEEDSD